MRPHNGAPNGSRVMLALAGLLLVSGCGDSTAEPTLNLSDMAGTYVLTRLAFDPQGVLPETNILTTLGTTPQLIVNANGAAQILYSDPVSGLFVTIGATTRTTDTGLRVDFAGGSAYSGLLLSRRMEFTYNAAARSLTFDGDAPDGANRQRLIQLVPAWENEQLLNPVPGRLRVTFQAQ